MLAREPRTQCPHHARQRRVRDVARQGAVIQVFHARAQMNRFVHRVAQHRVSGYDPQRGDPHQNRGP